MKLTTRIYKLKDTLDKIESDVAWSSGTFKCLSCQRSVTGDKFNTPVGSLCVICVGSELKKAVRAEDLGTWSTNQFMEALEALGSLHSRLTVLWRFHEVLRIVIQKNPSDVTPLKKLLIRNLGYVREHPLAQSVRQAAFQASVAVGESLVPLLLNMCESTPWQFYANVVMTLGKIAPDQD